MDTSQQYSHIRKKRLLEYKLHNTVETTTDDLYDIMNIKNKYEDYLNLDEFVAKLEKVENWELTSNEVIEKLSCFIENIKIKQQFISRLELSKTSLQKANSNKKTNENNQDSHELTKFKRKRDLKKSIREHHKKIKRMNVESIEDEETVKMIEIGPNGTLVPETIIRAINWNSTNAATRSLLMAIFDRETLAFHTLTGKRSPAFADCNIMIKDQLDPVKVSDIIYIVTKNCGVPGRDVKMAITTKCADENKMFKQREKRKKLNLLKNRKTL